MMAALFNHVWQSTLFAVVLGLLSLAFRRNRAGLRYSLWFAASVKFLIEQRDVNGWGVEAVGTVHRRAEW